MHTIRAWLPLVKLVARLAFDIGVGLIEMFLCVGAVVVATDNRFAMATYFLAFVILLEVMGIRRGRGN